MESNDSNTYKKIRFLLDKSDFVGAKALIQSYLEVSVCRIKFQKVNGELRTMFCTLKKDVIPAVTQAKSQNSSVCAVFEVNIDAPAWKSFKLDSLIEFDMIEE